MSNPIHKRGRYSVAIKKQVIKEALSGEKTLAQIASDFGISPETVKDWKKQAWQAIEESLTRKGLRSEPERKQKEIDTLQRLLGQREFELDWLSKKPKSWGCRAEAPARGCSCSHIESKAPVRAAGRGSQQQLLQTGDTDGSGAGGGSKPGSSPASTLPSRCNVGTTPSPLYAGAPAWH